MSTVIFNTQPICDTNAHFRAWGGNISSSFSTCGWVQTSDTGQINWTTIAAPAQANVVCGYEIWQMNDSLQSTSPVFFKIEYGAGTAQTNPTIYMTVGSGSNGSGGLTGICGIRFILQSANGANQCTSYVSGANNRIAMALWASGWTSNGGFGLNGNTSTSNTFTGIMGFFSLERTKDTNGNDTNEGTLFLLRDPSRSGSTTTRFRAQYWNAKTGPAGTELDWGTLIPSANLTINNNSLGGGTLTTGGMVYPVYHFKGIFLNPGLNVLCYIPPALQPDCQANVLIYGAAHTYMPLANVMGGTNLNQRPGGNVTFAMRFE